MRNRVQVGLRLVAADRRGAISRRDRVNCEVVPILRVLLQHPISVLQLLIVVADQPEGLSEIWDADFDLVAAKSVRESILVDEAVAIDVALLQLLNDKLAMQLERFA